MTKNTWKLGISLASKPLATVIARLIITKGAEILIPSKKLLEIVVVMNFVVSDVRTICPAGNRS